MTSPMYNSKFSLAGIVVTCVELLMVVSPILFGGNVLGKASTLGNSPAFFEYKSQKYLVIIKIAGKRPDTCKVYLSNALSGAQREWGSQQGKSFHFTNICLSEIEPAKIEVIKYNSNAGSAIIRPKRLEYKNPKSIVKNNNASISFSISEPAKLSVEFSDDNLNKEPLLIFFNPVEIAENVPSKNISTVYKATDSLSLANAGPEKTIIYFDNGIHDIGFWQIPSHIRQIYLSDGAIVNGYLHAQRSPKDLPLKITGRGIITNRGRAYHYPSKANINQYETHDKWYKPISISGGYKHLIEGITIIDATSFNIFINAYNTTVQNVKINGFRMNNDAITLIGNNHTVDDCFIRVNDDAIVPYGSNLTFKKCVFWQLPFGSVFQLGWMPHNLNNVTISDCDVIHAEWKSKEGNIGFLNAMSMRKSKTESLINNLSVSNIYFDTPVTRFLDVRPQRTTSRNEPDLGTSLPWRYRQCSFSNIYFANIPNSGNPLIVFHGYSAGSPSDDVKFDNFYVAGKKLDLQSDSIKSIISFQNINNLKLK